MGENDTRQIRVKRPRQKVAKRPIAKATLVAKKLEEVGKFRKVREIGEPLPAVKDPGKPEPVVGDPGGEEK